jgi:hypothetical protein
MVIGYLTSFTPVRGCQTAIMLEIAQERTTEIIDSNREERMRLPQGHHYAARYMTTKIAVPQGRSHIQ